MSRTTARLDAEIAAALSARERRLLTKLRPVEGLLIPADSRSELTRFWRAHPALRSGCLRKYGFDPIDDEEAYWRFGLAEPDHRDVLQAIRRNANSFSFALVKRWEVQERKDEKTNISVGATHRATRKQIPDAVRDAIAQHSVEFIEGAYRRHATIGGKEPCLTVGLITDYLRQAHMPEDFRYATKDRQRSWTRSVLESLRRRGLIGSSFGATARCYEPKQ